MAGTTLDYFYIKVCYRLENNIGEKKYFKVKFPVNPSKYNNLSDYSRDKLIKNYSKSMISLEENVPVSDIHIEYIN